MDGWIDGKIGRTKQRMDGLTDGWTDRMTGGTDRWIDGKLTRQTDGKTDGKLGRHGRTEALKLLPVDRIVA